MRKYFTDLTTLILLGIIIGFCTISNAWSQTKIMPLGNSITSGSSGGSAIGGYRDDLTALLDTEGVGYDFVGSLSDGTGFDADHEGHDGQTSDYIDSHIEGWLTTNSPDIVLLHIGTNDVESETLNEVILANINSIIEKIHSNSSSTAIVLASIIPRKDGYDNATTSLNDLILESYYNFLNAGYSIYYAGQNEVFKSNANWQIELMFSGDNVHPNDNGYEEMARVFYTSIMNAINASGTIVTDNFNRLELGSDWVADPAFQIQSNELVNTTTDEDWGYLAIYSAQTNPSQVSFRWGTGVDPAGIHEGGLALMMDGAATDANGYLMLIRSNGYLNLWTIKNGQPSTEIAYNPGSLAQPASGDEFKVIINTDGAGHHFKCYINGQETGEVTDPEKIYGNIAKKYAGVMLRGNRNNNIDDFNLFKEGDSTPPATINDLVVISQSTASIMLQWTAPGDDGNEGQASGYDIRFSKANITESNFEEADLATGIPIPAAPGTLQSMVIAGLAPSTSYFFAMKTQDEVPNVSAMSNITSGTTVSALQTIDDFERAELGLDWNADPQFQLVSGQLANVGGANQWDYIAAYTPKKNPVEIWLQWATTANINGIARGAIVVLDDSSPEANGYMIWCREDDEKLTLFTVVGGQPDDHVTSKPWESGPFPAPGDSFKVAVSRDENGNHFDLYLNKQYLTRLTDSNKKELNGTDYYAGVMLHGALSNNIEAFGIATEVGEPSLLEYISGSGGTGTVTQPYADSLVVRVTDDDGNPIQGVAVDYTVTTGSGALDLIENPDNNIRIQAERGILTPPMQIFNDDSDASGGRYISPPTGDAGDGRAEFQVYIKDAGNYRVWGRVFAPSANNNSFFFIMDGGEKLTWDLSHREDDWRWDYVSNRGNGTEGKPEIDPVIFYLEAGLHSFIVEEREYRSRLDHIIFTKDPNFTPSGKEEYDEYVTDGEGLIAAKYTFGAAAGAELIEAAVPGLDGSPVQFDLTCLAGSPDSLFILAGNEQAGTGGDILADPFVVGVTDAFGNPVPNIPVLFEILQGGGTLIEPQPQYTNDSGKVSTNYILGTETAENQVRVTSDSIADVELTFIATATGGIAENLVPVSGNNQKTVVNQKLPEPLVVQVTTFANEPVNNHPVAFQVTRGEATFDGNALKTSSVRTNAAGEVSVELYLGSSIDTSEVTVTANGPNGDLVGSPMKFIATGLPDNPKTLIIVSGDDLKGAAGRPLREPLVVKVVDQFNNPVSGHQVDFTVTAGGGNIMGETSTTRFTETNGEAFVYLTLGEEAHVTNRVQASAGFQGAPLDGSPQIFEALSGEVATIEYVGGNQQAGSAGLPLPQSFQVKILDNFGNPVPKFPVDFVVTQGNANFEGEAETIDTTDFNGIAELTLTLGLVPGGSFTAECRAYNNGVALDGNPKVFTATAAGLKELKYISGNDQTGSVAAPLPEFLNVQVLDFNDNGISGQTVHFEVMSGGGSFDGERQVDVPTGENGIAKIAFTLGNAPGDSNNAVRATASYNGSPLQKSPVHFIASARVGAAAKMTLLNNYLSGVVGNALPQAFQVKISDRGHNPVSNQDVTFAVQAGGGNIEGENSKTVKSGADGLAQITLTLGASTGDTNNVVLVTARKGDAHLEGSPGTLKASARASAAVTLLIVSGNTQAGTAGLPLDLPLTVKVSDISGNGVEGHPVTYVVKAGNGKLNGTDTLKVVETQSDGTASVTFTLSQDVQDNNVVQAFSTNGDFELTHSPVTFSATGSAGPVSGEHSLVACSPVEVPADGAEVSNVTVTLTDQFGNPVKNKQVKMMAAGSNNTIDPAQVYTNDSGQANFTLKSTKAERKQISSRDITDGIDLNQVAHVRFRALAASKVEFSGGNAQLANIGTAVADPLEVLVTDIYDNPVEHYPVTFDITGGGGHIYEVQPVRTDSTGIAQSTLIVGISPGAANTVEAMAEGLTNSPIIFMASGLNGTASRLKLISGNEQTAMGGSVLPQPLVVQVVDAADRAIWNHPVSFQVELGGGSIDGQSSKQLNSNEFGQASVQFRLGNELGMNIVKANSAGLAGSPITFVGNGTSGKASTMHLVSGDKQSGEVNGHLPEPLKVKVSDYNGNGVAGQAVTFSVVQGDASVVDSQPRTTDAQGLVTGRILLGSSAGKVVIEAAAGTLVYSPIRFEITATPQQATTMVILGGNQQDGTVGRELVYPFEVLVTDDLDNPVPGVGITFAVVEGNGVLLDGQFSYSDSNGVAGNSFQIDANTGLNKVYALKSGLNNSPLTFTANGVINKFPLISPLSDVITNENQTVRFSVAATDDDDDNESITYHTQHLPEGAFFDSTGNHEFVWTPDLKQAGHYRVWFLAKDPQGGLDAEPVNIAVKNMNRAPQIIAKNPAGADVHAPKRDSLTFQLIISDPDNDPIQYRWYQTYLDRTFLVSTHSTYQFISEEYPAGTYSIVASASDGEDSVKTEWNMMWTSVQLAGFSAQFQAEKGVLLAWETSLEKENLGFNIQRSETRNGAYRQMNKTPICSQDTFQYKFLDEQVVPGRTYYYRLEDIDASGKRTTHSPISVTISQPENFELAQNYPNPFNPRTQIRYQLPVAAKVSLTVYNVLGQKIITLVKQKQAAGYYTIPWDGKTEAGLPVASGIYLYRIEAGKFHKTNRMVLLK